ncbi:uncharacterized protein si:zfos-1056e6.1 isoform X4 [Xiphias gladius]|nr:uncharacterized protein si:zfos-1056e6.1 isoform X4 [Xiphias gladius]
MIIQIITTTFGLNSPDVIFKIRNHRGCLIPLNSSIPANSKHMPYVLEVAKIFQHVCPKPRTIPMTVINKSMKTRLQSIDRRIPVFYYRFREWRTFCLRSNSGAMKNLARLFVHLYIPPDPGLSVLSQEIECLNQKLRFLQKRMEVADSRSWKGGLTKAPLW